MGAREETQTGAPTIWMAPGWGSHLLIENYYQVSPFPDFRASGDCNSQPEVTAVRLQQNDASTPYFEFQKVIQKTSQFHGIPNGSTAYLPIPQSTREVVVYPVDNPQSSDNVVRGEASVQIQELLRSVSIRIRAEEQQCSMVTLRVQPKQQNFLWGLICGGPTTSYPSHIHLERFYDSLVAATHKRALRVLYKYRRHLEDLKERLAAQRDTMLANNEIEDLDNVCQRLNRDTKYRILCKQAHWIRHLLRAREESLLTARNRESFEMLESRRAMMKRLLEAVSWHRLMQSQAAESCIVTSTPTSSRNSVQRILQVIPGEEFYEEYFELMTRDDWWSIAQAHFENLALASDSRLSYVLGNICAEVLLKYADTTGPTVDDTSSWVTSANAQRLLLFISEITSCIRDEFAITDTSKSLQLFVERAIYPRICLLCFSEKSCSELEEKDKIWRRQQRLLRTKSMCEIGVSTEFASMIENKLASSTKHGVQRYFVGSIEAFSVMSSIVPCDLLKELMHGVVVIHNEAAQVLGTTQFSVETFFPILAYVLLQCDLPYIYAMLHVLENFAITKSNANGEEAYYVLCVHAAVEYICNFSTS